MNNTQNTQEQATTHPPACLATRPSYKWWVILMLWFVCFFNYADRQAIFAVFPVLESEFGFDKVELGLIGSAFMWVYAAAAPFAGFACDRFPRKTLILGGCIFWSFLTMATGWCSRLWHFVTVRAMEGLGETFYFPASMSLASDYHSKSTRSRALSFHQSSVYLGTIIGSWIGAAMAEHYDWRLGFYLFGGLGILLAVVLAKLLREPVRGGSEPQEVNLRESKTHTATKLSFKETLKAMYTQPAALLLMLAFVGANFVATIFLTWTPTFLVQKFGFRLAAAGLSGTVFIHLASAFSVPLAGLMADRLFRRFKGGRMFVQMIGLFVGATFVFLVGKTSDQSTLLLAMVAFGICKGFYDSGIFASLYDVIDPRARGSAAGFMNTVGWTGGALGPVFVGVVSKHGGTGSEVENMSNAIAFGGVVYLVSACLVAAAVMLVWKSTTQPKG